METLFTQYHVQKKSGNAPLAVRVRPKTLADYRGQLAAVGPGTWLRTAIENDSLSSVILYGPAGTGKTTLARIIANATRAEFVEVSAVPAAQSRTEEIDAASSACSCATGAPYSSSTRLPFQSRPTGCVAPCRRRPGGRLGRGRRPGPTSKVNQALLSRSQVVELVPPDEEIGAVDHALAAPEGVGRRVCAR